MRSGSIIWPGVPLAIGSALLFGASTPLAKFIIGQGADPLLLAGLLYLGSGLGLAALLFMRNLVGLKSSETPLRRKDGFWMVLIVLAGGVAGPGLLMVGLAQTAASTAALLLNLEGLATMGIAWIVFRENVDARLLIGAGAILVGAILLSWTGGAAPVGSGALFIAGACFAWGIDNNLTRKLSGSDPVQITMIKGLVAGSINIALSLWIGAKFPVMASVPEAMLVGFFGYGISLVLFVYGLRHLGSARTGAYFSTAPFIGAALAIPMFGDPVTTPFVIAAGLMGLGLYLHLTERHDHEHIHEDMAHEHRHVHDKHHQHVHGPDDPPDEPHSHWHHHQSTTHKHPHYPDLHHRHGHD